jgi:hypothetical protein
MDSKFTYYTAASDPNHRKGRKASLKKRLNYMFYRRFMARYIESLCCFSEPFSEPDNEMFGLVDWYLLI